MWANKLCWICYSAMNIQWGLQKYIKLYQLLSFMNHIVHPKTQCKQSSLQYLSHMILYTEERVIQFCLQITLSLSSMSGCCANALNM